MSIQRLTCSCCRFYLVVAVEFEQNSYTVTEGQLPNLSLCLTVSGAVSQQLPPPSLTITTNSGTAVGKTKL